MHPPAKGTAFVKYRLDKTFRIFEATVALDDSSPGSITPIVFQVVGDGQVLWTSKPVQKAGLKQDCKVSVSGVTILELRVNCSDRLEGAYAVWLDPRVLK